MAISKQNWAERSTVQAVRQLKSRPPKSQVGQRVGRQQVHCDTGTVQTPLQKKHHATSPAYQRLVTAVPASSPEK